MGKMNSPIILLYALSYAGRPAGTQTIRFERRREGYLLQLMAEVSLPLPATRQIWTSETDTEGFPLHFTERVEGRDTRVFEVEFLREEGVVISRGAENLVLPYIVDYHDPLSLLFALPKQTETWGMYPMVGGRAYAERLPDERISGEESPAHVFRLRPGLSLLYYTPEGMPLKLTQQVGGHVFEARWTRSKTVPSEPQAPTKSRSARRRRRHRSRGVSP